VPWGRFLDFAVTDQGEHPGVAIAWSDTPPGLGVPGPPAGHVLLLDAAAGTVRWQLRTPGYPVLAAADDQRGELAVVQQADPTQSVGYTLTGLSYTDGRTMVSAPGGDVLPLALAVGGASEDGWAVSGMDATLSSDGGYYIPSGGQVTLTDPATGHQRWLHKLPEGQDGPPYPDGLVIADGAVVVGAWLDTPDPTAADPAQVDDSVTALDYRTARVDWQQAGDCGDPLSLSAVTSGQGLVRAVTSHQDVATYAADGQGTTSTAGPGDFLSAATAPISAPGRTDLVAGNENGDVDAFDGHALAAGTEQLLWRAHLPGPVQQVLSATVGGRQVLVAAATSAIGVLDARTGRLLRLIRTPGTFAYSVTVISAAGIPAVVVPGSSLTAYALGTGARLWSQAAPSGAWFSDAAYSGGVVAAEYSSAEDQGTPATAMAAVGISAATGRLIWRQAADPAAVLRGQLWNGAYASPQIAGAGGDGVAFAWTTTDGGGQVDVRDIATGALRYSDASDQIGDFTQFLSSPGLGLIAVSQSGSALITPSGAQASLYPSGLSGALATTSSGREGFLTANGQVSAWGTDVFTDSSQPAWDSAGTYQSGTLVSGDFAGNGTQQVVAIAPNLLGYTIVNAETGYGEPPSLVTVQQGLALFTLHDAPASSPGARAQAAQASGARPAATYPEPSGGSQGVKQPSGSPSSGSRPVGAAGSVTPVTEPARTGSLSPGVTPATARHTVTAHGADEAVAPPGYSPAQMTAYLGLTGDGKGQTIAIVDATDDPDIAADAETFSQQYGLPGVCGSGGAPGDCFTLDVGQQSASAGSDPGWALETSLDVEWAHAIAPDATIKLVEAASSDFASLFGAVATATATDPAAVSMSWGYSGGEFSDETYYDHFCAVSGTLCVVSAGDYGHPGSYPAYNPAVIAVGGTTLNLTASGAVSGEQAWRSSGGGRSWVEPEPAYQDKVQSSGQREMPDVAFDADLATGVAVYDSVPYGGQSGWWEVGGTSVGAPSWSAILADTDQLRAAKGQAPLAEAGYAAQQALYSQPASVLAPVTAGPDNGFCPDGCAPGPGYDEITGLGSPRAGIDSALSTATG